MLFARKKPNWQVVDFPRDAFVVGTGA